MWFIEPDTIATMLRELEAAPANTFGVQARIFGYYLGRVYEGRDGIPGTNYWEDKDGAWPIEFEGRHYANRYATAPQPGLQPHREHAFIPPAGGYDRS